MAHWTKEQVTAYQKAKNSVGAYTGHYTRRRTAWHQALMNWMADPYSEIIKELVIAAREDCLRAKDKLEAAINEILVMGIVAQAYNDLVDKNAQLFAVCENEYIGLFIQAEKEIQRKAEQAAVLIRDETEERMKEEEQKVYRQYVDTLLVFTHF